MKNTERLLMTQEYFEVEGGLPVRDAMEVTSKTAYRLVRLPNEVERGADLERLFYIDAITRGAALTTDPTSGEPVAAYRIDVEEQPVEPVDPPRSITPKFIVVGALAACVAIVGVTVANAMMHPTPAATPQVAQ